MRIIYIRVHRRVLRYTHVKRVNETDIRVSLERLKKSRLYIWKHIIKRTLYIINTILTANTYGLTSIHWYICVLYTCMHIKRDPEHTI